MKDVTVALVGIAGYGGQFVRTLLDHAEGQGLKVVAAVARRPERCDRLDELKAAGAVVYPDLDAFYAEATADLVIISSPIQLHCDFTCKCLEHGSSVLCEKPIAATVQEALRMADAEARAPGFVSIGYQWSFADAILALKKDIMAGDFGRPRRLKTFVSWPRRQSYYERNDWAGAKKDADGNWILDSPANNATAHDLHNMLFVLGDTRETSARPAQVQAELYRANPIENFDTAAMRVRTDQDVEILFYTSHAVPSTVGPVLSYEFEKAVVYFESFAGDTFVARLADGTTRTYGNPNDTQYNKTWDAANAVRTGAPPACGIEGATPQIVCINAAQDSTPEITDFPKDMVTVDPNTDVREDDTLTWVNALQGAFIQCYDQGILPSEHGAYEWARPGKVIDVRNYTHFPGGSPA